MGRGDGDGHRRKKRRRPSRGEDRRSDPRQASAAVRQAGRDCGRRTPLSGRSDYDAPILPIAMIRRARRVEPDRTWVHASPPESTRFPPTLDTIWTHFADPDHRIRNPSVTGHCQQGVRLDQEPCLFVGAGRTRRTDHRAQLQKQQHYQVIIAARMVGLKPCKPWNESRQKNQEQIGLLD